MSEIICGIYKITSPSGRVYIGQSVNIYKAWNCRYKNGHCKHQSKLYNSINKYGWDNHKKDIIHILETYDSDQLNLLEAYYEELFDSTNTETGLNLRRGGGSHGKMSSQSKAKMSESKKGKNNNFFGKKHSEDVLKKIKEYNTGERHWMFGKKHTEETKMKLSETHKGENNSMFGVSPSIETRKKIGDFHRGKKWSLGLKASIETRIKMSERRKGSGNSFYGKKHTEKSRRKVSLAKSKIIFNTETGIFYFGLKEAAKTIGIDNSTLGYKLRGDLKNNTSFIYV